MQNLCPTVDTKLLIDSLVSATANDGSHYLVTSSRRINYTPFHAINHVRPRAPVHSSHRPHKHTNCMHAPLVATNYIKQMQKYAVNYARDGRQVGHSDVFRTARKTAVLRGGHHATNRSPASNFRFQYSSSKWSSENSRNEIREWLRSVSVIKFTQTGAFSSEIWNGYAHSRENSPLKTKQKINEWVCSCYIAFVCCQARRRLHHENIIYTTKDK